MSHARIHLFFALVWILCCPLAVGSEKAPQVAWETDYGHAMEIANEQHKMLLIFFHNPADPQSQRLESETLNSPEVQQKLQGFVCLRLPLDAKTALEGKDVVLLEHVSLGEMLGRPGVAIADFVHSDPKLHGCVVSVFPLTGGMFYGPAEMQVILDLPPGSLTQRTLIYAVRIHPERPASAAGQPDDRLLAEAESASQYQAAIRLQGHHGWSVPLSADSRHGRRFAAGGLCRELAGPAIAGIGHRVRPLLAAFFRPLEARCRPAIGPSATT